MKQDMLNDFDNHTVEGGHYAFPNTPLCHAILNSREIALQSSNDRTVLEFAICFSCYHSSSKQS